MEQSVIETVTIAPINDPVTGDILLTLPWLDTLRTNLADERAGGLTSFAPRAFAQ